MKLQENIVPSVSLKSEGDKVRDQIDMYKSNETSREKGMVRKCFYKSFTQETVVAGEEKLPGGAIKKLGLCSYFSIKKSNSPEKNSDKKKCFICS